MLALTLRWRMRRSVKKRSINVATLQAGFMASRPIADRDAAQLLPTTRGRPRDTTRGPVRSRGRRSPISLDTIARRHDERTGAASDLPVRQQRRSSRSVIRAEHHAGRRSRAARFSSWDAMVRAATCRTWSAGPSARRSGSTSSRSRPIASYMRTPVNAISPNRVW